ncbi:MAG TPA: APC family permease [Polyangiaceae bacterium]|nr:APC family permease [Polyangiaceae bacterium]
MSSVLLGRPLATKEDKVQRVGSVAGVAVLGLDALASAAYGPEALLTVLLPLGTGGLRYVGLLTGLIVGVLALLFLSYRQTIGAYPGGGGAYTVAKENLGTTASLVAASSLAVDYLLNVAVAISAGVGALISMVPTLRPYTLALCLGILAVLTVLNLRGVRTTGTVFMIPTYVFLGSLFAVVAFGAFAHITHSARAHGPSPSSSAATATASVWLLARAFANGCTAMTGVEAVSNGIPIFRDPAEVKARRTLLLINLFLAGLLVGGAWLCSAEGITATVPGSARYESVLSRIVAATVGRGMPYYVAVSSVVTVLALSANTSFADFPRLCRFLAQDGFLPDSFMDRGRRLAYSHGILALAGLAGLLLIVFGGITDALIPLFAVGAFLAFTMSQLGMVAHWKKQKTRHAKWCLLQNATGAAATASTLCVIIASKFLEGAWISVLFFLGLVLLFRQVRAHYDYVATATAPEEPPSLRPAPAPLAVVPLRRWNAVTMKALGFAMGLAPRVVAVQVLTDSDVVEDLSEQWEHLVGAPSREHGHEAPKLFVLRSKYRRLFGPLLDFMHRLARENPDRQIAVIVPELVERHWYQYLLHRNNASLLKSLLTLKGGPQIVIVSAPWYLADWMPERRRLFGFRPR